MSVQTTTFQGAIFDVDGRAGDADMLAAANADLVVESLDDVDIEALGDGRLARRRRRWRELARGLS